MMPVFNGIKKTIVYQIRVICRIYSLALQFLIFEEENNAFVECLIEILNFNSSITLLYNVSTLQILTARETLKASTR
jgi:hypothetical protein